MTKKSKSKRGRKQRRKAKVDVAESAATTHHDEPLEVKMERLQLDAETNEDDLLEEAIKLEATEKRQIETIAAKTNCSHGYEHDKHNERFYQAVGKVIDETIRAEAKDKDKVCSLGRDIFDIARKATASQFADVWSDSTQIAKAIIFFASIGTEYFLEGNKESAGVFASFANYFEQFAKINFDSTQADLHTNKLVELIQGDDHTLVSFFKKRIPCSCLDEIYEEVKSLKKKGVCWNSSCKHSLNDAAGSDSEWKLDRSSLMSCARCRQACYCSIECQKADWRCHKSYCDKTVAIMIAFEEAKCYQAT